MRPQGFLEERRGRRSTISDAADDSAGAGDGGRRCSALSERRGHDPAVRRRGSFQAWSRRRRCRATVMSGRGSRMRRHDAAHREADEVGYDPRNHNFLSDGVARSPYRRSKSTTPADAEVSAMYVNANRDPFTSRTRGKLTASKSHRVSERPAGRTAQASRPRAALHSLSLEATRVERRRPRGRSEAAG